MIALVGLFGRVLGQQTVDLANRHFVPPPQTYIYSTVWTVLRVRRGHAHERNCSIMHEFESLVFDVITNLQSAMYRRKTSASSGLFFE
jgi:hypothetical protein